MNQSGLTLELSLREVKSTRLLVVVSFDVASISKRQSFPSPHGGRNPVRSQGIPEGVRSGFPLSRQ
jgi:hypothetical protein